MCEIRIIELTFWFCFSLGPLVNKVKEYQVETIVDSLCSNMVSDKEQLRDISSIGLKTVISELPLASNALAANVCKRITGKLSSAIEKVPYLIYCCSSCMTTSNNYQVELKFFQYSLLP
jgi:hypothetical protein